MIKPTVKQITSDSAISGPQFSFSEYAVNTVYHNDGQKIDFVTDGEDLYVFAVRNDENEPTTKPTLKEEAALGRFIKLVSKGSTGKDGAPGKQGPAGEVPRISARFDGKQLILKSGTETIAVTGDLTGPAWKPEKRGDQIVWMETKDRTRPEPIDLSDLRERERPLLLRVDSDNTKRSDEISGPANMIQWKYEGDEHWTNLIAIDDLLNIALAGVCTWKSEEDGNWHIGHKEVVKATYDSNKDGKRIISQVELGDVLFDAGPIAKDMQLDIAYLEARLNEIEEILRGINIPTIPTKVSAFENDVPYLTDSDLDGYATENWVNAQGFLKNIPDTYAKKSDIPTDYVKSVKLNGESHSPVNGVVDLGNIDGGSGTVDAYTKAESDARYIRGIKVNNGSVLPKDNNGIVNITIGDSGISLFDIRFDSSTHKLQKTTDGQTWIDLVDLDDFGGTGGSGLSESEVKHLVGQILEGTLDSAIPEYVKGADHNYFIRLNDLADYTTRDVVAAMIRDAMTDQNVDYYRVFTLYQRTNSPSSAPAKPVTGVWEWNTAAEVDNIALKPNASSAWSNHPENATTSTPYLWMTSATYSYLTKSEVGQDPWETPICLTAEPGEDGADGDGVEFIYILCTEAEFNSIKNTTPVAEHGDNRKDDLPTYTTPSGNGWTDHPSGITEIYQVEAVSIRTKDDGIWGAYSNPTIWAKWGEDGVDGDGVEYIFAVATENETIPPENSTSGKRELSAAFFRGQSQTQILPLTDSEVTALGASYQISDWCPDGTTKSGYLMPDLNWTDNPSDVGPDQPYEFVAIRKKKLDPVSGQMKWGPFSTPALWGFWGQKTVIQNGTIYRHPYTCFAFTRSATDITGYTVVNPWTQTNPAQTYAEWIAADNTRETGYYENPLNYIITLDENNQVVSSSTLSWSDTIPAPPGQLYMITNHIGDEASGNDQGWTSPRAWGDASGFQVEYANSSTATDNVYNRVSGYTLPKLDNYDLDNNPNLNDPDGDGIDEAAWRNYVKNTLHLGEWGDEDDITDPDYMATCYKKQEGIWSAWQISRIKGEKGNDSDIPGPAGKDGTDIEFVYFRTDAESHRPGMSPTYGTYNGQTKVSEDLYEDDFLPMATANGFTLADNELKIGNDFFWHDHPAGVTENLPCEWVGMRHTSYDLQGDKLWGNFNIALWSKWGANGRDGDGIEYVFWGLTEADVHALTSTWPTQQTSNNRNNGANVDDPNDRRPDKNGKFITDNEYLPAILINNVGREAVDNNPGIADNKYVYASKRKYNGTTKTWGEFSEIKLWNEQSDSELNNVVLDITNDTHPIYVDEEGRITDRYMSHSGYSTGSMYLYRNLVLLSNAEVFISDGSTDVQIVSLKEPVENNCYEKVSGSYLTMTQHGVTATVTASYVWKYDDSNSSKVELKVAFNRDGESKNPILTDSFDIIIKVKSTVGDYIGTDILRLVPKHSDKEIELLSVPRTQRTSSEGSHDYSDSEFNFYGYYGYDVYPTLDLLSKTHYFFKYDDQANWTEFYIPLSDYTNPNYQKLSILQNQYDGKDDTANASREYTHFYFDINGNSVSSSNDAFYEIWLYNTDFRDNDHGQWTRWSMQAYVYPAKFVDNDDYPINELYFGIGFNNGPIDEANVHIVYPGKDGKQGPVGPVGPAGKDGKDGKDGEPGKTVVTYQYLNGKVIRMSNWTDNQLEYSNGETAVDGVYYLDVVKYVSGSTTSYYKCISDVTYTNKPSAPNSNWETFIPQSDAWFETMLANSAYIENLTSKQVVITDNNNIVAGMTSGTITGTELDGEVTPGNVRIWAGSTTNGDLSTAPFTVNADGSVRASNIDLAGGNVSGSFTIGANGSFSTRSTGSGNTTQTVITSGSVTNTSYTGSTISSEAKLGDGKVVVTDKISDFNVHSELESQHLTFYNTSNGMPNARQSITTPYIINGVYGNQSSDWGPIFKIQSISQSAYNALTSPDSETLYIVI